MSKKPTKQRSPKLKFEEGEKAHDNFVELAQQVLAVPKKSKSETKPIKGANNNSIS